jgi:hypothetical protein
MSYPRHEYFRRVLCNLLGNEIETGQLPEDEELAGKIISRICYDNAVRYLNLPAAQAAGTARSSAGAEGSHHRDGHPR